MNHGLEIALCSGVAVPLVMFAVLAFFGYRIGKPVAGWVAVAGVGTSLALSAYVLFAWLGMTPDEQAAATAGVKELSWVELSLFGKMVPIFFKVKLDALTVVMYFMVTLVSTCIFVFSVGYMSGHSDEVDGVCMYHRFFCYLSLFEFSMLGLVISSSLFFLFVFWELVGLCSYLLIGFYFHEKYASNAAIKAFVTNRVGDFGFLLGLMMVFFFLGTFDLDTAAATFREQWEMGSGIFAAQIDLFGWQVSGMTLATVMGIALFCGAIGKSAQFPLHVWLPDAMAGPTPVSALIHAATMVAAGVYLVARIYRLLTPDAQFAIAIIGCITLTMTALIAIVQTDIKKILAYSTLSQLGYMIFGLGIGAWTAALFHLITHAFFKAMLFLGSGQVIEGCHHVKDIRQMGGLRKKMPVTCWTFFIGVMAIAGFGIPLTNIGLGGFLSKDEILAVAYERTYNWDTKVGAGADDADHGHARLDPPRAMLAANPPAEAGHATGTHDAHDRAAGQHAAEDHAAAGEHGEGGHANDGAKRAIASHMPSLPKWMFWLPIIIAYVTPFYMMRCWWLTFCGKPRDKQVYEHAHEMRLMWAPLVVLAVGTFFATHFLFRTQIAGAGEHAADAALVVAVDGGEHHAANMLGLTHEAGRDPHRALLSIVGPAWIVGIVLALLIYWKGFAIADRLRRIWPLSWIYVALEQKLFFDHLYNTVLVAGTQWVLAQLCRAVDTYIVDGIPNLLARMTVSAANFSGRIVDAGGVDGFIDGLADTARSMGDALRQPQTGRIRNYVLFGTAGASLVLVAIVIIVAGSGS